MRHVFKFSAIAWLTTISLNAMGADVCDLTLFNEAELNEPYRGAQRILKKYSPREADQLSNEITKFSEIGLRHEWYYTTQVVRDGFGNVLRFNGSKIWNESKFWKYHGSDKATTIEHYCSWGGPGGLKSQCLKTCSLQDVTLHPGD